MYKGVQYHTFVISALDREVSFTPKMLFNTGEILRYPMNRSL
jgi:hypothetical protein